MTPMTPTLLPGEHLLTFGELLLAEYRKKGRVEFRKMFQLQDGQRLQSSWGTIGHSDIVGRHAGDFIRTIHGTPILIRRPNLEEYVLYMKRGPAIAYPKVLYVANAPVWHWKRQNFFFPRIHHATEQYHCFLWRVHAVLSPAQWYSLDCWLGLWNQTLHDLISEIIL